MNSEMEEISQWSDFDFDKATLQTVWDEATYKQYEVMYMYALNGLSESNTKGLRVDFY